MQREFHLEGTIGRKDVREFTILCVPFVLFKLLPIHILLSERIFTLGMVIPAYNPTTQEAER
jgi:hypothetical protein